MPTREMAIATKRWDRADFAFDPITIARKLIGCTLVRRLEDGSRLSGQIVETEAYLGERDRAAHSFGGHRSERVASMYLPPGHCYVYFTYGMHHCMNVVCGAEDEPVAVLLRALRPLDGIDHMRVARGKAGAAERNLCAGPAKLCQAFGIDRTCDGFDLTTSESLWIEWGAGSTHPSRLRRTARIGVDYAREWAARPLRWRIRESEYVSRK